MGFKELLGKGKSGLATAGKRTADAFGQAGDNIRYNNEITALKEEILEKKFTRQELKNLKRRYNIISEKHLVVLYLTS